MKALGILCGAGSLLWEAQQHGMEVIGNVDTRPYYRSAPWVWPLNFESPFVSRIDELDQMDSYWHGADLVLGHPPCGSYSRLGHTGAPRDKYNAEERAALHKKRQSREGLIPLFCELTNRFQPKVFALDNLVKALKTFPREWWENALPNYKLTFIEIINWDYGSPQTRHRLWVIGSLKKRFSFEPPVKRIKGPQDTWEAVRDLPWEPWIDIPELTHVHQAVTAKPMGGFWVHGQNGEPRTQLNLMTEAALGFMSLPPGYLWPYKTAQGRFTKKAGQTRVTLGRPARVPTGNETLRHPLTGWPLTIRERCRIMGWPDDFLLSDESIELNRSNILKLVRLTGRAVPNEFPRYLIPQLMKHARRI